MLSQILPTGLANYLGFGGSPQEESSPSQTISFGRLVTDMQGLNKSWLNIGTQLHVPIDSTDSIHTGNCRDALRKVLFRWVSTAKNHEVRLDLLIKACANSNRESGSGYYATRLAGKYNLPMKTNESGELLTCEPLTVKINMPDMKAQATSNSFFPEEYGSTEIQTMTFNELVKDLKEVQAYWDSIGETLGISSDNIDNIESRNVDNVGKCLQELLHLWVSTAQNNEVSLDLLIQAISDPDGADRKDFAIQLARKYQLNIRYRGTTLEYCESRKVKIHLTDVEVQATDQLNELQEKVQKLSSENIALKQCQQDMEQRLKSYEVRLQSLEEK